MKIILDNDFLSIDGRIVIDARRKFGQEHSRGWVDPKAWHELGAFWGAAKNAYVIHKQDPKKVIKELVKTQFGMHSENAEIEVEIAGGIPEHWNEMREGKIKFR